MEKNENVVDGRIIGQTGSQIIYFKNNAQEGAGRTNSVNACNNKLIADLNAAEKENL